MSDLLYVSTASLKNNRNLANVLEILYQQGFRKIEISALHHYQPLGELAALIQDYQGKGVEFIFHNYFPRPQEDFVLHAVSQDTGNREKAKVLIGNAVDLARQTGVDLYCFHPAYRQDPVVTDKGMFDFSGKALWDRETCLQTFETEFMDFYHQLALDKEKQDLFVGIENLFPPVKGENHSLFCSFTDIEAFFKRPKINETNLGILIDLGHLALSANIIGFGQEEFLDKVIANYGDRIYEVHLSENDGIEDLHWAMRQDSTQLQFLKKFQGTGTRLNGRRTRFCIESRGLTPEQLNESYNIVRNVLEGVSCDQR